MVRRRFPFGNATRQRPSWARLVPSFASAVLLVGLGTPADAEQGSIAIELNKLETQGNKCMVYFVVNNKNKMNYEELKLDLVLFRPDGVIGRRFAVDLAPLKADKRVVKIFELADTSCDQVGSFLINDVIECKAELGPVDDCLKDITVSSLTSTHLTK
jgi:hypothetical protein